jgi:predicted acyl esterase
VVRTTGVVDGCSRTLRCVLSRDVTMEGCRASPPALKAIIPWEIATDLLREFAYQDGVRESGFVPIWWNMRMKRGDNKRFAMAEDFLHERDARPLDDDWWVRPDEIVPVDIEILASSTLFEAGSTLRLDILGHDADRYPAFRHKPTVNQGRHSICGGAAYDAHLLIPVYDLSRGVTRG